MKLLLGIFCMSTVSAFSQGLSGEEILRRIDENQISENRVVTTTMIIHGKRNSREVVSKAYSAGTDKSYSVYLSPDREKGTKMLKLEDKLWIYNPVSDRTVQLSGHMLRQSVMGSDLSYEDMMEQSTLIESYEVNIEGEEMIDGRKTWILSLSAKVEDVSYHSRKIWVDQEWFVPLKEQLYAKSGQLLKKIELSNVKEVSGRWVPMKMVYTDVLKGGKGTEFIINEIAFDADIPEAYFTKAILRR